MTASTQNAALLLLLGLGAADLIALNAWAVPGLLIARAETRRQTTMFSAKEASRPAAQPRPALAPAAPPPRLRDGGAPQRAYRLEFVKGTWWIGPLARRDLARWASTQRGSTLQIEVAGHADASGPDELNQSVSEQRATAVAELLIAEGLPASRIEARGYGETRPSDDGNDRRVELWLREGR